MDKIRSSAFMKSNSSHSADELGKEPLSKLIIRFSGPAILALIVNALYNLVDRLYLSHFVPDVVVQSAAEQEVVTQAVMSGLGFAMPYMHFVAAFGVMIGAGSASLLSIRLGAKDQEGAEKIVGQCVALKVLVFLFLPLLAYLLMDPVLQAFGAKGYALDFARDYLTIILFGSVFMHLSYGLGGLIRAEGKATMAMVTMIVGAVSNIILDPIFIFGWLGLPAMGIAGAAWATNLAMLTSSAVAMAYMAGKWSPVKLRLNRIVIYRKYFVPVLMVGLMPAVLQIISSFVHAIYIRGYEVWGGAETDMLISAVVIIQGVHTIVLMPACGIAQAAQPIIGYSYGAGKYARMMKCTVKAAKFSTLLSVLFLFVMMLGAPAITRAFIPDVPSDAEVAVLEAEAKAGAAGNVAAPEATPPTDSKSEETVSEDVTEGDPLARRKLYDKTVWGMRVLAIGFPLFAIPLMLSTYYQSIGHVKAAFVTSMLRFVIILVPLIIILPYLFGGVDGVWYAQPIADVLSASICTVILLWERRKIRAKMVGQWHAHGHDPIVAGTAGK